MRGGSVISLLFCAILSGCALESTAPSESSAGLSIQGMVHGGQQPVVGSHVHLMAANTTGYGAASVSLLNPASTGVSDSVGAFVLTGRYGQFTIPPDYSCTPGTQVYIYALGGYPGASLNSAAGFLAALGQCPTVGNSFSVTPYVAVNEVSTVAAAYAFAGFATDATHVSSSGTALAQVGIANAFANAGNLANIATGAALVTTPAGNGTVPQATINTLGNILAACVNTNGPGSGGCGTLFLNAMNGSTAPTDTATAAINIAHNPGVNVAALYGLQSSTAPFQAGLTKQPNDLTLAISFTGGGIYAPLRVALDGSGNAWIADAGNASGQVAKLSPLGVALSPSSGYTAAGLYNPDAIALDLSGHAWIVSSGGPSPDVVTEFSNTGTVMSPAGGFTGGGLGTATAELGGIAVDGSGNIWIANQQDVTKLSNGGGAISPASGYTAGGVGQVESIAIDGSNQAWTSNAFTISELSNSGLGISPSSGYSPNGHCYCSGIAIDGAGNAWVVNESDGVIKLNSSGTALSPSSGFKGGGLVAPRAIAIDGAGNPWVANNGSITELSNSGLALSPESGYTGPFVGKDHTPGPYTIAIDGSGNVWTVTNLQPALEFIGVATPVVTPLAAGVKNGTLGTRP